MPTVNRRGTEQTKKTKTTKEINLNRKEQKRT
jgi:hypothetical protein